MPVASPSPKQAGRGAPADLLERLRGDAARRLRVDPGLAGGLREWLEDGVADAIAGSAPSDLAVVVDRWALAADGHGPRVPEVTVPLARGAMVAALFRQHVTTGQIGDPVADALAALGVDERSGPIVEYLQGLAPGARAALHREVAAHAQLLASSWPPVAPGWLPRTADRLSIPLAGGRVVLTGVVDLVLGAAPGDRASVCLVDVRSERRAEHRADRHFHGLLETVRAGAPPFRLATYYTATGEVDVDDVDDELLFDAVRRCVEGVRRCAWPASGLAA